MLEGILTDGDLRRHLVESPNLMELSINDIMEKSPITLNPEMLAVDVLKLYEQNNVDDLIVIDDAGKAIGSVDIQDMPKLKLYKKTPPLAGFSLLNVNLIIYAIYQEELIEPKGQLVRFRLQLLLEDQLDLQQH